MPLRPATNGENIMAVDTSYTPKIYRKDGGDTMVLAAGASVLGTGGTVAGAGLSDFWSDCPLLQMAVDPTLGVTDGDDFTKLATDGFPYDIVGTNGTFVPVAGQAYGVVKASAPGTDNDEITVSSNNNLAGLIKADATKNWWFEARVKINQITTAQGAFVGLSEETGSGADFMTDNTMALKVIDNIGFQIIAATDIAAIWQTVMHLNGGARVAISATAATASTDWVKLGMKSVLGVVTFYVDGVALADTVASTATNYPLDQVMQVVFARKAGSAAENSMLIDWWRAAQLR